MRGKRATGDVLGDQCCHRIPSLDFCHVHWVASANRAFGISGAGADREVGALRQVTLEVPTGAADEPSWV
jgi:hypothetical protein